MKFFTLQEILEKELKNPEFKAGFEAEKRVLAAEREQQSRRISTIRCQSLFVAQKTIKEVAVA